MNLGTVSSAVYRAPTRRSASAAIAEPCAVPTAKHSRRRGSWSLSCVVLPSRASLPVVSAAVCRASTKHRLPVRLDSGWPRGGRMLYGAGQENSGPPRGEAQKYKRAYARQRVGQFAGRRYLDMRVIHVKERSHPVRYDNKCGGGPCGDITLPAAPYTRKAPADRSTKGFADDGIGLAAKRLRDPRMFNEQLPDTAYRDRWKCDTTGQNYSNKQAACQKTWREVR